eukprot:4677499-Pleurochrysis_carterae.AAC.1
MRSRPSAIALSSDSCAELVKSSRTSRRFRIRLSVYRSAALHPVESGWNTRCVVTPKAPGLPPRTAQYRSLSACSEESRLTCRIAPSAVTIVKP